MILLNGADSPYYEETKKQAKQALTAYPGGLQIGGGIRDTNAKEYLDAGASHVIVTSFVFKDGRFHPENLEKMVKAVGREHLVLDVSCRKKDGNYYVYEPLSDYNIPKTKNGIYYFRDRFAENYPEEAGTNINDRASYNITFALLDLDTNKLYIYKLDTNSKKLGLILKLKY